jgi:hypothetical protein
MTHITFTLPGTYGLKAEVVTLDVADVHAWCTDRERANNHTAARIARAALIAALTPPAS